MLILAKIMREYNGTRGNKGLLSYMYAFWIRFVQFSAE